MCKKGYPEKGGSEEEAASRSQGGFGTKVHIRAEGDGRLMRLLLTAGQRNESTVFERLLEGGEIRRRAPGRPRQKPGRVVGDKGYSSKAVRGYCRRRRIRITIARRIDEHRTGPFSRAIYRTRNLVERLINRLKQFRRSATRYEKRGENYRAIWIIAASLLWLNTML